jgi:hypothetical protein
VSIFALSGTPAQQALVQSALAACDFPFDRLVEKLQAQTGRTTIPVEWADLSRYAATVSEAAAKGGHAHVHEGDDTADPLRAPDGRAATLGLFWYSGRIQLDLSLEAQPDLAREVFLSEAAHAVDVFYATDEERAAIAAAWHPAGPDEHGWFDVGEYETWMGEGLMGAFCRAFAPSIPVTLTQFVHPATPEIAAVVRRVLLREPEPTPDADPLAGFPYAELDAWAARRRPWWSRYARVAADAYLAWR